MEMGGNDEGGLGVAVWLSSPVEVVVVVATLKGRRTLAIAQRRISHTSSARHLCSGLKSPCPRESRGEGGSVSLA